MLSSPPIFDDYLKCHSHYPQTPESLIQCHEMASSRMWDESRCGILSRSHHPIFPVSYPALSLLGPLRLRIMLQLSESNSCEEYVDERDWKQQVPSDRLDDFAPICTYRYS